MSLKTRRLIVFSLGLSLAVNVSVFAENRNRGRTDLEELAVALEQALGLQRSFNEVGIAVADASPRRGYRGPLVVALYGSR